MPSRDQICPVCDKPILPGEAVVKAGHDLTHLHCLPSGRRAAEAEAPTAR